MPRYKYLLKIIIFVFIFFSFTSTVLAALNLKDAFNIDSKSPLSSVAGTAGYATANPETRANAIIALVIKTALSLIGVIFLGLMIYGGYLWMTARGNEEQVNKAKNLITAAIIGTIIVLSAYAISYYVIKVMSGAAINPQGRMVQ